jgi:hypothetical protein
LRQEGIRIERRHRTSASNGSGGSGCLYVM